jgi:hypothetical protein
MSMAIPFIKLGIPADISKRMQPNSPKKAKLAIARGLLPTTADVQLAACYAMALSDDVEVSAAAKEHLRSMPTKQVISSIGTRSHPKILEFLIEYRTPDFELDECIGMLRSANNRTVRLIARRAHGDLCDLLSRNHERLLVTPDIYCELHANPSCANDVLALAKGFLRMQRCLPDVPDQRPFEQNDEATEKVEAVSDPVETAEPSVDAQVLSTAEMDLEAEIEAALLGKQSPALLKAQEQSLALFDMDAIDAADDEDDSLGAFQFDFTDEADQFTFDLTRDRAVGDHASPEERLSLEQKISGLTVGQKIKLAYRGNISARKLLIRDTNKIVASAVVKSGRLSDQEVANFAANKNLDNDVLREIAANREWTRKYPVKVALINNPKTPVGVAVRFVASMQKKDLLSLTRNRNIPSVVSQAANRLFRQKYLK